MATGLYPGKGVQLYLASSNPQEPVWLSMRNADPVIPDDDYSIGKAVNAGLTTSISVLFDVAPTTDAFDVLYAISPDFTDEYILQSVAAAASQTLYTWATNGLIELDGFIRIQNKGTADINEAYLQQRAVTTG